MAKDEQNPAGGRDAAAEGIAPVVHLLCAHAALVQNTSDRMGLALTEGMSELHQLASGMDASPRAEFEQSLSRIMVALQAQDALRQQVGVLIEGLKALGQAEPPTGQDAKDWVSAQLTNMRAAYVMQEQYVLHEDVTGVPAPVLEPDTGPLLFD